MGRAIVKSLVATRPPENSVWLTNRMLSVDFTVEIVIFEPPKSRHLPILNNGHGVVHLT